MKLILSILFTLLCCTSMFSQNDTMENDYQYSSIDFGYHNIGISFGNSSIWRGLRVNFSDCGIKKITGINITIWKPERNPESMVEGIAFGLWPSAKTMRGISLGFAAVVAEQELMGINIGGLALDCNGDMGWINVGGLATVVGGNLKGINLGGLAIVSEGGNLMGINCGGLATISDGEITGFNLSSAAIVAEDNIIGLNIAGIALVSQQDIIGLNVSLGQVYAVGEVKGFNIAGYKSEVMNFAGVNINAAWCEIKNLTGISVAGYNRVYGIQTGLTIGLLNITDGLEGVQIGLLNIAWNNRGITKVLPFVNMHFD